MKKVLGTGFTATEAEVKNVLASDISKSKKMIALFDLGFEVKEISDVMSAHEGKLVRYNFVYNVLSNHINMNGIPVETTQREGKKDSILEMYVNGKSNKEISIDLKTNYNYVFNTIKDFKLKYPEQAAAVEAAKQKQQAQAQ
jgi:hypothetical protein